MKSRIPKTNFIAGDNIFNFCCLQQKSNCLKPTDDDHQHHDDEIKYICKNPMHTQWSLSRPSIKYNLYLTLQHFYRYYIYIQFFVIRMFLIVKCCKIVKFFCLCFRLFLFILFMRFSLLNVFDKCFVKINKLNIL